MSDPNEGQVSDAENLRSEQPDTPIADDQAVAAYPDSESGEPEEGAAGPNANSNAGDGSGEPVGRAKSETKPSNG